MATDCVTSFGYGKYNYLSLCKLLQNNYVFSYSGKKNYLDFQILIKWSENTIIPVWLLPNMLWMLLHLTLSKIKPQFIYKQITKSSGDPNSSMDCHEK